MAINNNPFGGSIDMAMVKKYIEEVGKSVVVDNKATESKTRLTTATKKQTDVLAQLNKLIQSNNAMNTKLGDITNKVNTAVNKQAKLGEKLHYSWKKAFTSFTMYMSVTTVFYTSIRTLQSMVQEVTDLDKALTELQKVTDLQGASLERLTEKAFRAGEGLAKTGTEVIQATTEFAKAGYNEEDAMTLGKIALMYTNIADEAVSAGEASEFIISQMKAFNIEANNSQHIIDAVNEVANKFAVSSADIANNLGKSSALLSGAGVSFEESLGLLTAGTEITRNASRVSNGLKTITLRLQGMNDEGERDLTLIPKMKEEFAKLNISLVDSNGNLKNTYEILSELAPQYADMTAAEKAWITEAIAGKFQAQNAAAILTNFQVAIDATTTALNSNGSAAKENAVYVDSIAGKVQKFNTAFEELAYTTINSGLVKGILDLGTGILNLTTSVGGLSPILTTVLGIIIAIKAQKIASFIDNTRLQINLLGKDIKSAGGVLKYLQGIMAGTITTTQALALAFGAVTAVISIVIMAVNAYNQAQQEMRQQAIDTGNELIGFKNTLDETISKIEKYGNVLKDTASTEQSVLDAKTNLAEIQKSLVDQYGAEADGIDLVNGKIDEQIDKVKKLAQVRLEEWEMENKTALEKAKKYMSEDLTSIGGNRASLGIFSWISKDVRKLIEGAGGDAQNEIGGHFGFDGTRDEVLAKYKELYKQIESYGADASEDVTKYLTAISDAINHIADDTYDENKSILETYDTLKNGVKESEEQIKESANNGGLSQLSKTTEDVVKSVDALSSSLGSLNGALEEQEENGQLSLNTVLDLIDAGYATALSFDAATGAVTLNKDALLELAKAKVQVQMSDLAEQIEALLPKYGLETQAALADAAAQSVLADAKKRASEGSGSDTDTLITDLNSRYLALQKVYNSFNSLGVKAFSTSPVSSKKTSSSGKTWWEKQLDALKQQFNYNEITLQEYMNGLGRLLSQLKRGSDAWREVNDLLQEQKLSQVDDDYKRGTISLEQYIARLKELIKTYKYGTEVWNDLADKIKKANEELLGNRKDNYDKAYDAAMKLIDDEIDKVQQLRDEREEYYDNQITSLEKLNDETERQITLTELQQNLINAQNEKNKRVFVKGIGWTWQADSKAIDDAQKAITDFQNEQAIKDLEKARDDELATLEDILDGWSNYKDAWSDIQNTFEDAQNRIMLTQQFGANFEADILNGRLSALEEFKNAYINIQSQIASASGGIIPGINDYTSLANGVTLNSSMPNSSNIANLISSHTAPAIVAPATSGGASYVYNFESLVLPNVTNSQQFITALKSMVNLTKNQ